MLKTITPKSIAATGASSVTSGIASYLSGSDARQRNAGKLLAMSRYLAFGQSRTESRIVAHDHSDDILTDDTRLWVKDFMLVKDAYHKLDGIPYYHFIISPEPSDKVSAEECVQLAREWVTRCYPDSQWFAAVHDDNAHHVTHAHVIVNSVLPATGHKIHRSNADVKREARTLQQLCVEHNLTPLEDIGTYRDNVQALGEGHAHEKAVTAERAERALVARGGRSYKADVRKAIDFSVRNAYSWEEFVHNLDEQGVDVSRTRKGITYVIRDWEHKGARRIPSARLGKAYTQDGIVDRLGLDFDAVLGVKSAPFGYSLEPMRHGTVLAAVRIACRRPHPRARHCLPNGMIGYRTLAELLAVRVASSPMQREIDELSSTITYLHRHGFTSRQELLDRLDEVSSTAAQADRHLDDVVAGERRMTQVVQLMLGMDRRKADLARLEARHIFNPTDRGKRRELRDQIAHDERWVSEQLAEARLWAESKGLDPKTSPRIVATEMLKELRTGLSPAREASRNLHDELEQIVIAERVLASLDEPHRLSPSQRPSLGLHAMKEGTNMRTGSRLSPEQRARYTAEDWARLAASIGLQLSDNKSMAAAEDFMRQQERRRRDEADAWLMAHGIDPHASQPHELPDVPRHDRSQAPASPSQAKHEEQPQQ